MGKLFAGAVSRGNEAVDGNGDSSAGGIRIIFRNVYRLSGTGHRGDAGQYSYFCEKDFVPPWSGMGGLRYGSGENLWVPVLFCHRAAPNRAINRGLPSVEAVRYITGKCVHVEQKMRDGYKKRETGHETAGGLSEV